MTGFFVGLIILLLLFLYIFYPALLYLDSILGARNFDRQNREWRMIVAQKIIIEYQMICTINEVRKKLGMEPIPQHAVIDEFRGFGGWTGIRLKVQQSIRMAMDKMGWL
jgi:hypothetical protein